MRTVSRTRLVSLVGVLTTATMATWTPWSDAAPFAYVPNAGDNTLSVIDTASASVVTIIPVGDRPFGVAVNATGTKVYLTHPFANIVSVIETATNTVTDTVAVGEQPQGIAVNRAGTRVYVANCGAACGAPVGTGGTVTVIDTAADAVVATIPIGAGPFGVAVNPAASRAYVSNFVDRTISIIDTDTNTVIGSWNGFEAAGLAVSPDGTRLYAAHAGEIGEYSAEIASFDTQYLQGTRFILAFVDGGALYALALSPSGRTAFVTNRFGSLYAVDLLTGASRQFLVAPPDSFEAWGVSVTPDGKYVYVANPGENAVAAVDPTASYGHGLTIPTITVGQSPFAFGQFIAPPSACFGLPDGTPCDDGDSCTSDDTCSGGVCAGTPMSGACDDGNSCTTNDMCSDGACVGTPMRDGSFCLYGPDMCSVGTCTSGVCVRVGCDDGNPCTTDSCDRLAGCTHSTIPGCTTTTITFLTTTTTTSTTTTTLAAVRCGDVNGGGIVNVGDALVVAQFDVGLRQCSQLTHPEVCDVNGDGACNIGDALRIAQCDVGLTSCAFTCNPFVCP